MDLSAEDFGQYETDPADRQQPPEEHGIDDLRSASGEMDEDYERTDDGWPFG